MIRIWIGILCRLLLVVAQGRVRGHLYALVEQLGGRGYRGHGRQRAEIAHLQRNGGGGGGGGGIGGRRGLLAGEEGSGKVRRDGWLKVAQAVVEGQVVLVGGRCGRMQQMLTGSGLHFGHVHNGFITDSMSFFFSICLSLD